MAEIVLNAHFVLLAAMAIAAQAACGRWER